MIINLLIINKLFISNGASAFAEKCWGLLGHILLLYSPKNVREKIMRSAVMNGKGRSA
jgi:hypothetical protein